MEIVYESYQKKIETTTYYFVKKFAVFPEFKSVPPVLEGYGMHTDFEKACALATVNDIEIRKQLLHEIESGVRQAKIIDLNDINFISQKAAGQ